MPRAKKQHLKQRKDGRYCAVYHGKQFMGWTEEEALQARKEYQRMEEAGEKYDSPTIIEYALKWLPMAKTGTSDQTYAEAACLLEKLTKHIGMKRFNEIIPSDIKGVYTAEFSGLSDSYIKSGAQLYRALFDAAVSDGYCRINPAREKSAKPHRGETKTKTRSITKQEREWIGTLCTDHRAHPAVMAMLYAGIRPQEAKAMNIDRDVDFERGVISVTESVHMDGTNRYNRSPRLKTAFSKREIPLLPPLRKALEGRHGMLITSADGQEVSVQAWRSAWESYTCRMETAINGCQKRWWGRKEEHKGKELPPFVRFTVLPYDLRHSFCTMCRDNGVEINTCVHWMGHKDAKMILKIYDEFSPERSKNEAEKLEKTLFHMQNDMQK